MTCIVLNTIVLVITWAGQPAVVNNTTNYLNYGFAVIFTIEAILKLAAFGVKEYFSHIWNQFDFTIVVLTIISTTITLSNTTNIGAATTFLRAFKIARIFRLIEKANSLMMIFETLFVSLPALANVSCLLILFIYMYTILGVQLFADVMLGSRLNMWCHFQTFGAAFLTLIKCSTANEWNLIMDDAAR